MIPLQLDIYSTQCALRGLALRDPLVDQMRAGMHYVVPDHQDDYRFRTGAWDGREYLFNYDYEAGEWVFPTGLVWRAFQILETRTDRYTVNAVNHVPRPEVRFPHIGRQPLSVRDYQAAAVVAAHKLRPRAGGVLRMATASGKTRTSAKLVQVTRTYTVVLVNQKDLMQQFRDELAAMLDCPIGQVGDGVLDIQDITVATVQTVAQGAIPVVAMMARAEVVIIDETHTIACDTMRTAVNMASSARIVLGLSASPWRDDGKDILIEALVGPIVYDVPASELIDKGWLVPPTIRLHAVPLPKITPAHQNVDNFTRFYRAWVVENAARNQLIVNLANTHMAPPYDGTVLILVEQLDHGEHIQTCIPGSVFMQGKLSSRRRKAILADTRSGALRCLIATRLADQALDLPSVSVVILGGGGKSSTRALQRVGRALRTTGGGNRLEPGYVGKQAAWIHDFDDPHAVFKRHLNARIKLYRTEPRFAIERVPLATT